MAQNQIDVRGAQLLIRNAVTAIRRGNISRARALLVEATDLEPANDHAWLWRAGLAESPAVRRFCLERVLADDREHATARRALAVTQGSEETDGPLAAWRCLIRD